MPYDGTLPLAVSRGIPDEESHPTGIEGISGAPELTRCRRKQLVKIDHIGCLSMLWAGEDN